ncbi:unnamed protein product [Rotaria sp. Silwood1]|nr:unnamed protein product [Rotaria sp. Silwood1]CAF3343121.1 unnamed protein product [Rotaria sp. Silwood1]CAF3366022.1 unnamed protein product [Rotaria sp. Silwood1]CAF3370652.1 unnamed protein product [Rotaria sp. Silwood1]CAF4569716.1 unnamed protein product [Rotaria sp. Silwood1]
MMHSTESSNKFFHDITNPFERRQFAFQVLPEEKDPMSRAKNYSFIMPTLKIRLQQLITTYLWEYIMFILSIWSFISLLIGHKIPELRIFFELTHEITHAALFIEVFCKLYIDCRWFFYDIWNFYDLICVIVNSPFIYNLFVSDHLGVPQINSIQRLFRTLHAVRLIRIHNILRCVLETILIALSSIYNTLLLEFVIVTVFALLSIAFEGDTPFLDSDTYEPYENYTEALYSYYMCITLEGVNEVAEQILELDSPQFTTAIGLIFYIFAALVTYSVGQLLAAVIATTLGKAIDQIKRDKTSTTSKHHNMKLLRLQSPSIKDKKRSKSRCSNIDEIQNFSQLKPDDLALLIILFQTLDKNINEHDNILRDVRHIGEYISKSNKKKTSFTTN